MAIGAPIKNSIHSIHSILGIHSKRRPVDIAHRNRYALFFAKLFFLPKKKRSEGDMDVSGDAGGRRHDLETDGVPVISIPGTQEEGISGRIPGVEIND